MNTLQCSVIALLKSAVTGQAQPLPEDFSIAEVLQQTEAHHVSSMIYEGAALCGVNPLDPAMQTLFRRYCKALQISERQMRELNRVFATFEENGIDYMPLKGCKMKSLYPRPELRIMGDADVLIRIEEREKIAPIMQSLGFSEKEETDHEWIWTTDGLHLELHKRLIPSYTKDFYAYFGEGWQLAKQESGNRHAMSAEEELVFLFTHFAKHYRDGGIGFRYVVDLWLYLCNYPELDENYVLQQLDILSLREFYRNIRQLIAVWFDGAQTDEKIDFITEFIFASGSWGEGNSRVLSRAIRDGKGPLLKRSGKLTYLRELAFPGVMTLRGKYTVLKKHPWMLPLVWLWRPFYKVLFERGSLEERRETLEYVTVERIDDRRQALHYVGLDYNF